MNRARQDIVIQIRLDRSAVRRGVTLAIVAAVIAVPSYLIASAVSWPAAYPFQAGTPISAAEVNATFAALEAAIAETELSEADVEDLVTNGALDLHPATTVGGAAIVTDEVLGQDCEPGEVVTGVATDGALTCAPQVSYSGADFAVSGQTCPEGEVADGVEADGSLSCGHPAPNSGVINVTYRVSTARQVLWPPAATFVLESFTVDKKSPMSTLIIEGTISFLQGGAAMRQVWRYGSQSEVRAQINSGVSSHYGAMPIRAIIAGHTETGPQALELSFHSWNDTTTLPGPFSVYNPNFSDSNWGETQSVYVVWEVEGADVQ